MFFIEYSGKEFLENFGFFIRWNLAPSGLDISIIYRTIFFEESCTSHELLCLLSEYLMHHEVGDHTSHHECPWCSRSQKWCHTTAMRTESCEAICVLCSSYSSRTCFIGHSDGRDRKSSESSSKSMLSNHRKCLFRSESCHDSTTGEVGHLRRRSPFHRSPLIHKHHSSKKRVNSHDVIYRCLEFIFRLCFCYMLYREEYRHSSKKVLKSFWYGFDQLFHDSLCIGDIGDLHGKVSPFESVDQLRCGSSELELLPRCYEF